MRARTKQTKDIMGMIAGNSCDAVSTHTSHLVKSLDASAREEILKSINHTVTVPVEHVAVMKSTLNLTWNLTRDIRRWLNTLKISLTYEGKTRDVMKEWIGSGLCCEEIPASVLKEKKMVIELRRWCYLYNLVGYVLKYLDDLKSTNLIYDHPFIPTYEVHLKTGGDHGGASFKTTFQIANVLNPNQPNNTVMFSITETKDHRTNILLCLERYKAHIEQFRKVKWEGKTFRVFIFGDYEFLCALYGRSGASGRHLCLWCEISSNMLKIKLSDRVESYPLRTLLINIYKYLKIIPILI